MTYTKEEISKRLEEVETEITVRKEARLADEMECNLKDHKDLKFLRFCLQDELGIIPACDL